MKQKVTCKKFAKRLVNLEKTYPSIVEFYKALVFDGRNKYNITHSERTKLLLELFQIEPETLINSINLYRMCDIFGVMMANSLEELIEAQEELSLAYFVNIPIFDEIYNSQYENFQEQQRQAEIGIKSY